VLSPLFLLPVCKQEARIAVQQAFLITCAAGCVRYYVVVRMMYACAYLCCAVAVSACITCRVPLAVDALCGVAVSRAWLQEL
jgi:hypothetical protein